MLAWPDIAVLTLYFAAILGAGLWFGRNESDTEDFFLGGRRQHWLLVGLSILATEVSALTFLSVPGRSFSENCWYLQMYAGSIVGRLLIVYLLLPAFYGGKVTTVYEYLGTRFGPWTRTTASLMFFASRILGSAIRLLVASMALAIVFDGPLEWIVLLSAAVAVAYATCGGIKSIIATDAIQAMFLIGGAVVVVVYLFGAIPGGWVENLTAARDSGKLQVIHGGTAFNDDRVFWVLMIYATVQTMAALGVDQDLTQRMLTCPDLRRGQRSLLFNTAAGLPVVCLFLLVGVLLSLFYESRPEFVRDAAGAMEPDRVFATFIRHDLPSTWGLKGLLIAGIFAAAMSSLDSALGAMSSTAVTDFYRPYVRANAPSKHYLRIARIATLFFGVVLVGVALLFRRNDDLLEAAFGWASLVFGGMLGVFVLGVTTKSRGRDRTNVFAMLSSVAGLIGLKLWQPEADPIIAWPWWIVIGSAWTCGLSACFKRDDLPQ
ncbi:MAG: hypothetical protein ACE5E5_12630 [Phycisphaerae bacterium]